MKIAYDYEIFWKQRRFGGISRYFSNLIKHSCRDEKLTIKVFAQFYFNEYLNTLSNNLIEGTKISYIPPLSGKIFEFYTKKISNLKLLKFKPDIIHRTLYSNNFSIKKKTKVVITVYDLIHEIFSNNQKNRPKQIAANLADKIICISNNTKSDLINIYNIKPEKISVTYLGCEHMNIENFSSNNFIQKSYTPYILFVGSRKKYKNFDFLLDSYSKSSKLMKDFNIILFGGEAITTKEIKKFKDLNFRENQIIHIKGDDSTLKDLFINAKAYIFPSLYEGFGLPLLESMYVGCPAICSNIKTFIEVADNSVEYFDPKNNESLINSIEKVVYSNEYSKTLIKRGRERAKRFSWANCAVETNKIYKNLI